jgi:hypothetical protein
MDDQPSPRVVRRYRSPLLNLPQAIDGLIASGRSEQQAGLELLSAIEAHAIRLLDFHPNPSDQAVHWTLLVLRGFLNHERRPTLLDGSYEYVSSLRIDRSQFEKVFGLSPNDAEQPPAEAPPIESETMPAAEFDGAQAKQIEGESEGRHRGRPEEHDWEEGKLYFFNLVKERGDPTKQENQTEDWHSKTDAAKVVASHLGKHAGGHEPDISTARRKIASWLGELRRSEAAQNRIGLAQK